MAQADRHRAGAQHDQHADQAGQHRQPAPQPHPLAQDRDRQHGDQQGRGEQHRIDLRQRQHRKGVEGPGPGQHVGRHAQRDPPRMVRSQVARRLVLHQHHGDQRKAHQRAEEDDLERGVFDAQMLDDGIMRREKPEAQKRNQRTPEVVCHPHGRDGLQIARTPARLAPTAGNAQSGLPSRGASRPAVGCFRSRHDPCREAQGGEWRRAS